MGTVINSDGEKETKYHEALYGISKIVVYRLIRPWYYNDYLYALSPTARKERKFIKILHTFTENVIKERERNFEEDDLNDIYETDGASKPKKRLAMLDLLISAKRKGEIDDEGIREEVDTFMFEGHDTTAMALTFALLELANHRKVQDKIFEECQEIFGESKRAADYNDLQNMKYLEMCMKESLRLYPSVHFISRATSEDLSLSKATMPANSVINIHIFDLHRNPKIFPDPEKFDPDRFLPENCQGRHPYSYVPFSAGPRNCIGQKFAMLEMKSIVSAILRNYILEPIQTQKDLRLMVDIILRNNSPIYVKFVERI